MNFIIPYITCLPLQIQFIIDVMGPLHTGLYSILNASGPLNKGRSLYRDEGRKRGRDKGGKKMGVLGMGGGKRMEGLRVGIWGREALRLEKIGRGKGTVMGGKMGRGRGKGQGCENGERVGLKVGK